MGEGSWLETSGGFVGHSNHSSIAGGNDGYGFAVKVRVMLETEK